MEEEEEEGRRISLSTVTNAKLLRAHHLWNKPPRHLTSNSTVTQTQTQLNTAVYRSFRLNFVHQFLE